MNLIDMVQADPALSALWPKLKTVAIGDRTVGLSQDGLFWRAIATATAADSNC